MIGWIVLGAASGESTSIFWIAILSGEFFAHAVIGTDLLILHIYEVCYTQGFLISALIESPHLHTKVVFSMSWLPARSMKTSVYAPVAILLG